MALSGSRASSPINVQSHNLSPPRLEPVEHSSNTSEEEPGPSWLQTMNHLWHNLKQGLPGPLPKIPTFCGGINDSFLNWLEDFTIGMNGAGIPRERWSSTLGTYMGGLAKELYLELIKSDQSHDFDNLTSTLAQQLSRDRGMTHIHADSLMSRRQKRNESIADFYQAISKLSKLAYPYDIDREVRERNTLQVFVNGLALPIKEIFLRQKAPRDVKEALQLALLIEAQNLSLRAERQAEVMVTEEEHVVSAVSAISDNIGKVIENLSARLDRLERPSYGGRPSYRGPIPRPAVTCYRCGRKGHIQKYCRSHLHTSPRDFENTSSSRFPQTYDPRIPHSVHHIQVSQESSTTEPEVSKDSYPKLAPGTLDSSTKSKPGSGSIPKYLYFGMILGLICLCSTPVGSTSPMVCSTLGGSATWKLPQDVKCPILMVNDAFLEPENVTVMLYQRNVVTYREEAFLSKKIMNTVKIKTSFFSDIHEKYEDINSKVIGEQECKTMINFRRCDVGNLNEQKGLWRTFNKVQWSYPGGGIHCCRYELFTATN